MRGKVLRTSCVLFALLGAMTACQPTSPVVVTGPATLSSGGYEREDVGAVAQGGACSGDTLAASSWFDQVVGPSALPPGGTFGAATGRKEAYTASAPGVGSSVLPNGNVLQNLSSVTYRGDPQMVALPDGELVLAMQLDVPAQDIHGAAYPANDLAAEAKARKEYTERNVYQFVVSKDCGNTWMASDQVPSLDSAVSPADGSCHYPYVSPSDTSGKNWLVESGFDNGMLIADAFHPGTLFFSSTCNGAKITNGVPEGPIVYGAHLWRLRTQGPGPVDKSWQVVGTPAYGVPQVMTTTADGSLWMLQCNISNPAAPMVSVMRDAATAATPTLGAAAVATDPTNPAPLPERNPCAAAPGDNFGIPPGLNGGAGLAGWSISRVGKGVRIAYPRNRKDGKTVDLVTSYVHDYTTGQGSTPSVEVSDTRVFSPAEAGGTIVYPTFIERSDPHRPQDPEDVALLYWLDFDIQGNTLTLRYSIVRGLAKYTDSATIGEPWEPHPTYNTGGFGDYMNGAYACLGGHTTFFPIWGQSGPNTPSLNITAASIDTQDSCTPRPFTGNTTTTPGTLLPSTTATAPKTTTSTTSVPVSTTTAPTAPPGFRVASISLGVGDCALSGGQHICTGSATFSLKPGPAGSVAWTVTGTLYANCADVSQAFNQPQTSVPISAGATTATSTYTLAFASSEDPNANTTSLKGSVVAAHSGTVTSPSVGFYDPNGCLKP